MDSRIRNLFERYQSGKAGPDERRLVEQWFAKYDAGQENVRIDEDRFYKADEDIRNLVYRRRNIIRPVYWMSAAAIAVAATALFLFRPFGTRKQTIATDYIVLSAPRGLKKQFRLSDSTTIYLNAGSVVRIPYNYNVKTREIELTGEAYFDVKHNAAKPFSIHSGKLHISDIGTTFNVKAYPEEPLITVAVESGEVKVEKNKDVLAPSLTANTQLQYNNATGRHAVTNAPIENSLAWHRNILRFENASFNEIARSIERWYNVDVKLSNRSDSYRHYTVSFRNEPLSKVLKVLGHLTGATYQIDKQTISVNLKNCRKV